jgi:hypothetical protein
MTPQILAFSAIKFNIFESKQIATGAIKEADARQSGDLQGLGILYVSSNSALAAKAQVHLPEISLVRNPTSYNAELISL